jgi:Bacterial membrane protein YfhO
MARPSNVRFRIKSDYVAALGVAVAPLIYFLPATLGSLILSPDDAKTFNTPLRVVAATLVRDGSLPLWNPYMFSGMPLHGAAQAGLLFPLNWFYLISSPPVATNLMILSTYMLAAVGAYFYARRAGADLPGSIATSLIWQFSAFMLLQMGHTNVLHTAAMMPWVLWSVDGYIATGERRRGVLLAALFALQVFSGHQQTLAYSFLLAGAYGLAVALGSSRTRKLALNPLALMTIGLALAAVQILPTWELLRNSPRATATYDFFGAFSMPPNFVMTFFAPFIFGVDYGRIFHAPYFGPLFLGEYLGYAGILTIMLALAAVALKRDLRTKFWCAVFVLALLMAFGRFLPFQLYKVVYQIPVLNLFRSPSRHLMEVQFALAVLAGRGLTAIRTSRNTKTLLSVACAGGSVLLVTCLTVTWWRPAAFRLAREVPVTLLRAPELFVPIVVAAFSAIALLLFARTQSRKALMGMFVVLVLDLIIFGQGSGWFTHSLAPQHDLWRPSEAVKLLRQREAQGEPPPAAAANRILTQDLSFDPNLPVPAPDSSVVFALQPDIYMMEGVENAAGYDGFGLARYSHLAGDMKVWGELTDAEGTLRGDSRALDLLNVRYLLSRAGPALSTTSAFPTAAVTYEGQHFDANDLGLRPVKSGRRLSFNVPPTEVDHIALLTNMSWSNEVADHTPVAQIELRTQDGKTFNFDVRAGDHTSEWAYDRSDIRSQIKHQRAPVGSSYPVEDAREKYDAHTYVSAFSLPAKTVVTSGSITVATIKTAPDLGLNVARISLADGETAAPLRRNWITEEGQDHADSGSGTGGRQRWTKIAEAKDVAIFENDRVLPRAWLVSEAKVLTDAETLSVIRTSRFSDGKVWDPRQTALVEGRLEFASTSPDQTADVQMTAHEPNRVTLKTKSSQPAILVLSENHYPGWRAYVDGQFVTNLRVDYNLRGVALPAGEHTVEFIYRPKSVLIGVVISLLTLVGLVLWWKRLLPERRLRVDA